MTDIGNTLYVTTAGASLRLDHGTVRVEVDGVTTLRVPLLRLAGIVCFGAINVSPWLVERCADDGRSIVLLDRTGRFHARIEGTTKGNVLLRRAQHLALSDGARPTAIARQMVAGKLQNSRHVLLRAARDTTDDGDRAVLVRAGAFLTDGLTRLRDATELNVVRGIEGDAARTYFGAFGAMVREDRATFAPRGRTRRPPRDPINALLSFLYALLRAECESGLEGVGLDPQVGYLHALRPGRPALALDLMEEMRPILCDRLALTLVNRRQLRAAAFRTLPGGAVYLGDEGRREVLAAWQKRKHEEVEHRVMRQKVPLGVLHHVQARLLARHLRGDLEHYPPFVARG
ncbi:MAG: type I-C CRISPR-associated endonuclease Cas1 [Dehalococcoidia bacterium]|nr:type I-C CRISPR-associated endonuclease Cas1 [Dehalococcoidia bacterium]